MKKKFSFDLNKQEWIILALIIIGAIGFRLLMMTKVFAVGFDDVNYLKLAASGRLYGLNHVLHTYWSPFYPLMVALFSYIVPNFEIVGGLFSILCASFVILPLFFFVRKNFSHKLAWVTALLVAFYSISASYSIYAETEFLYSILAIGGILIGWRVLNFQDVKKSFWVGILFGCAYLTRPEGFGFLLVFAGIILLILLSKLIKKEKLTAYILILLFTVISFGAVASPYLIFLKKETGVWTISTKGTVNQQGSMYVKNMDQYSENPFHVLLDNNTRLMQDEIYHIGNFVTNLQKQEKPVVEVSIFSLVMKVVENFFKLLKDVFPKVFNVPMLVLLGLGLFSQAWKKEKFYLNLYLLSFLGFFWFLLIPAFHIEVRYYVPLIPIGLIWIGQGAFYLKEWLSETLDNLLENNTRIPIKMISAVLVIFIIFFTAVVPEFIKQMQKNPYTTGEWEPAIEQKKAGLWLKEHGVNHPIVMAYNHAVSFYAGNYNIKESVEIPENKIEPLLDYAMNRGVKYIVLNDRYKHNHPLIEHLYEQKDIPDCLKLIYKDTEQNGLKTLIYEIIS